MSAIRPFGESGLLVEVDGAGAAQSLWRSLDADPPPGVVGAVPGLRSVLIEFEPLAVDAADVRRDLLARGAAQREVSDAGRVRHIPVVYGGEHGPDLDEVAQLTGMTPDEVVELHANTEVRVLLCGFAPGFAYIGDLPEALRVPRLGTPRTRTPRGSVAIAGAMTGIYPAELPGGWRVIGRTPIALFDPTRSHPSYLEPGDRVRFERISDADWHRHAAAPDDW